MADKPIPRCLWCERKLRTPQSVARGYGPVCWDKQHPRSARPPRVVTVHVPILAAPTAVEQMELWEVDGG